MQRGGKILKIRFRVNLKQHSNNYKNNSRKGVEHKVNRREQGNEGVSQARLVAAF